MNAMNRYLAGVLTVIAVGVLTIAYSLVFSRATIQMNGAAMPAAAAPLDAWGRPLPVNDAWPSDAYARSVSASYAPIVPRSEPWVTAASTDPAPRYSVSHEPTIARPTRTVRVVDVDEPVRVTRRATRVERPRRDWKRTAMIIGGTTAASAGVGGLVGGKKGALIGAAIGGGASTLYETTKKP